MNERNYNLLGCCEWCKWNDWGHEMMKLLQTVTGNRAWCLMVLLLSEQIVCALEFET